MENKVRLVELEIRNMEYAIELTEKIKPVIEKFNGKVLNKRLETALKEIDKHIFVHNEYRFEIGYYVENNCILIPKKDYNLACYVKQRELYLVPYLTTNNNDGNCVVDENNRIKADVIIAGIEKQQEYLREEIEKLKKGLYKVDEYKEKLEDIKKQMEDLNKDIPYLIGEYFGLNYRIVK